MAPARFEELVESLLQVDEVEPTYGMNQVAVIDKEMGTVTELKSCLEEVSQRWLPQARPMINIESLL